MFIDPVYNIWLNQPGQVKLTVIYNIIMPLINLGKTRTKFLFSQVAPSKHMGPNRDEAFCGHTYMYSRNPL